MPRWLTVPVLTVLALLALPSASGATVTVSAGIIDGERVVVATDDGTAAELEFVRGVDETTGAFAAVQNPGGAVPGNAGCEVVWGTIVGCDGEIDAVIVVGNGGDDEITLTLITDGLPQIEGGVDGGPGDADQDAAQHPRRPAAGDAPAGRRRGRRARRRQRRGRAARRRRQRHDPGLVGRRPRLRRGRERQRQRGLGGAADERRGPPRRRPGLRLEPRRRRGLQPRQRRRRHRGRRASPTTASPGRATTS